MGGRKMTIELKLATIVEGYARYLGTDFETGFSIYGIAIDDTPKLIKMLDQLFEKELASRT